MLCISVMSGCAQLMKGEEQPVVSFRDAKTFRTTCSGTVENWGSCYRKAKRTCENGYDITDKSNESNGIVRQIIFTCK